MNINARISQIIHFCLNWIALFVVHLVLAASPQTQHENFNYMLAQRLPARTRNKTLFRTKSFLAFFAEIFDIIRFNCTLYVERDISRRNENPDERVKMSFAIGVTVEPTFLVLTSICCQRK